MYSGRLPKKPFINLYFFVVKDQFGQLHYTCHGNILQNKGGRYREQILENLNFQKNNNTTNI